MSLRSILSVAMISVLVSLAAPLLTADDSRPGTRSRSRPTDGQDTSGQDDPRVVEPVKVFEGFRFEPPTGWKPKRLAHRGMRQAEYILPGPKSGDRPGELIVYYFGRTSAGSAEANLQRWKGQFTRRPGVSEEEFAVTLRQKVSGMQVTILELRGDFSPMQVGPKPAPSQANSMMLAAVIETGSGNYYIRTLGPLATLEHWKKSWYKTVLSIKPGKKDEKADEAKKESDSR